MNTKRPAKPMTRLWSKVRFTLGCWDWMGALNAGYGVLQIGTHDHPVKMGVHRLVWESVNGRPVRAPTVGRMGPLVTAMYELVQGEWLTPNGNPTRWTYRADTNDFNTINSCLGIHDEYGLRGRTIAEALDIGGYLGSVGVTIAVDNPAARVVIVEPVPWNAELIEANAELNGVTDRVTVFHGSAGPKGETTSEVWFHHSGNDNLRCHAFVGNNSFAYDHGGDNPHESKTVPTLGLAALLDRYALAPDFTKIDCEGGEWPFLTAPVAQLRRLPFIVGEAHNVRGRKGGDIVKLLAKTHDVTIQGDPETTCGFTAVLR